MVYNCTKLHCVWVTHLLYSFSKYQTTIAHKYSCSMYFQWRIFFWLTLNRFQSLPHAVTSLSIHNWNSITEDFSMLYYITSSSTVLITKLWRQWRILVIANMASSPVYSYLWLQNAIVRRVCIRYASELSCNI